MPNWLLVGFGGFLGSVSRYLLGSAVLQRTLRQPSLERYSASTFISTLTVNILGCLIIGLLGGSDMRLQLSHGQRLFLWTGILGGFTTFSAFGWDTFTLIDDHMWGLAAFNVVIQVVVGMTAVWAGYRAGMLFSS